MILNQSIGFLGEVAAELVYRKISYPTHEQIAEAMAARINRQGEIYVRLFGCGYRGQVANGTREFIGAMAADVYKNARS